MREDDLSFAFLIVCGLCFRKLAAGDPKMWILTPHCPTSPAVCVGAKTG